MKETGFGDIKFSSGEEEVARLQMLDAFKSCPLPEDELLSNMGLFLNSKNLSRILFFDFLYKKIIDKQGIIVEFGTRWGQNSSLFAALRGIYEPFNRHRKIVSFDTFEGFVDITEQDGNSNLMKKGVDSVTEKYEDYLCRIMEIQEADNPLSHIRKFEVIKGNAIETFDNYLDRHPETIVALAYFDFDLYKPTRECLRLIEPHLTKGSILGFDELNDPDSPGETLAVEEIIGLNNIDIQRYRYASRVSFCEMG